MLRRLPFAFCYTVVAAPGFWAAAGSPDFNREVRPILSEKCFFCHGPDPGSRKAKLRLDTPEGARKVIDEQDLSASELLHRITTADPDEQMPPQDGSTHKSLSAAEVDVLKRWIASGSPYAQHWAFLPPAKPTSPALPDPSRAANPIDAFLLSRLAKERLAFTPEADRETLIRRVTLDLTGLPPSLSEIDSFREDGSATAYEKVVDRLLDSPRFGERMCLHWLDLARYGDSSAMHADGLRDMWPWRDWVIEAFNANMPYDRFTIEQLAGDLLPNATTKQRIASGFNRNNVTSDEGGAIPEELRVEYAVDRVMTTSKVWLALSVECAQCHDHKYDPITQQEYYRFFAFFNQASDPGMQNRNGNQTPVAEYRTHEFESMLGDAHRAVAEANQRLEQHRAKARAGFDQWLDKQRLSATASAAPPEPAGLVQFFALDEASGETVTSLSGRVAQVSGKLQKAERGKGRGLKFEGTTVLTCSDFPDYERDRPFTYAAWIRLPKGAGSGAIFARMDEGRDFRGYDFWIEGGKVGTHIIHRWPDNALKVVSKNPLEEEKWQLVAITYDGSSKADGVKIYIEGALSENAIERDALRDTVKTEVPFKIGSRHASSPLRADLDDVRIYERTLSAEEISRLAQSDPISSLLNLPPDQRTADQQKFLLEFYLQKEDREYRRLHTERAKVAKRQAELVSGKVTAMVMQDEPTLRTTFVLNRGQYDQPLKNSEVTPDVPAVLPSLSPGAPANRLGLAQWLVQPDHPLTARAAVNRFWAMLFGEGMVKTLEDFGTQGDVPEHPELLDWLAADFVAHGWDVKRCLKRIVMSHAYRQSARVAAPMHEFDPENRLLARGSRFRMQAETLRDNALYLGGILIEKIGGPSVKPYQPEGIWEDVALDTNLSKFVQDHGEKLYRRSMYTYWKRSAPAPTMTIFDAPTREKCTARRPRTNTPLQALVTLNDPQFIEAARCFARRLIKEGGPTPASRLDLAFRLALSRHATAREVEFLSKLASDQSSAFTADREKAGKLLAVGEGGTDPALDAAELAAWTMVASTILNLDEVLTRN